MSDRYVFDEDRPHALFRADAYEGGIAWDVPSSPTLGTATLYGHRVITVSEGEDAGRQVVVEETRGSVRTYLVPWPGETVNDFNRRRSLAVYVNIVEPIVDAYVDAIVPKVKRDLGDAAQFLRNLDGDGQSWGELVGDVALQAALDGVVAAVLDLPAQNPATTRAEEIEQGVGLRATLVPLASWAWLCIDDDGRIEEFAYADSGVTDARALSQKVRVWVWRADDVEDDGTVEPGGWAVYDHTMSLDASLGASRDAVVSRAPVRSGPLPASLGGRVPVVMAYHRRIRGRTPSPRGKSLAAGPAAIGRQIYQLLSQVEDTQRRAPPFLSMPTAAANGMEPEVAAKLGPGSALPAPAGVGSPSWVTFPAEPLADLRSHVAFLTAAAFRTSGLEIQADATAQVQSGEALRVRSRDFESRAAKFAASLADFERRGLDIAASLLGLDREMLRVNYPQRYVLGDPSELLAAAVMLMQTVGDRLGPRGIGESVRQAVDAALSLDDATLTAVLAEVESKLTSAQPPAQKELFGYDYEVSVVTVNEIRATKGLGPIDGGDVPVMEWAKGIDARAAANAARVMAEAVPPPTPKGA